MKTLFKKISWKKADETSLVGVEMDADGIGLAQLLRGRDSGLLLKECRFVECGDDIGLQQESLNGLVQELELEGKPCSIVLPGASYQLLLMEAPKVPEAEMRDAVRWGMKELIDFPVAEAVLDVLELPEGVTKNAAKMIYVVATRKAVIERTIELIEQSGLDLRFIDISELALRNIMNHQPVADGSHALVRLHGRIGMVNLLKDGLLYFTRQFELSEEIYALSAQSQLMLELQRSFDYYERQMGQIPPRQVLFSGTMSADFELPEDFQRGLSATVETLDPRSLLPSERDFDSAVMHRNIEAIGCALRAEQSMAI